MGSIRATSFSSPDRESAPRLVPASGYAAGDSRSGRPEETDDDKKKKNKKWYSPSKFKGSQMAKGMASMNKEIKKAGASVNKSIKSKSKKGKTEEESAKDNAENEAKKRNSCFFYFWS